MDQPQKANAAQLAARNIKSAKGKHSRRPGLAPKDSSGVQWGKPVSDPGLFGGNIQASGTFDFAAPSNLKLNTSAFGDNSNTSSDVSDSENGRVEENGRFLGDDRIPKRPFGQSAGPVAKSPFQLPKNLSADPIFGSAALQKTSEESVLKAKEGFPKVAFGANTASASAFIFGNTSQITPSSGKDSKSAPNESNEKNVEGSLFNLNNQNKSQITSTSSFTFGAPALQAPFMKSSFVFGQTSASSQASVGVFGSGSVPPASSGNSFTGSSIKPAVTEASLSSIPPTPAISNNIFGTIQITQTSSPKVSFGSTLPTSAPGSTLFAPSSFGAWGTTNNSATNTFAPATTNNLFGDQPQKIPQAKNLFAGINPEDTKLEAIQSTAPSQPPSNIFSLQPATPFTYNPFANLKPTISVTPTTEFSPPKLPVNPSPIESNAPLEAGTHANIFSKNFPSTTMFTPQHANSSSLIPPGNTKTFNAADENSNIFENNKQILNQLESFSQSDSFNQPSLQKAVNPFGEVTGFVKNNNESSSVNIFGALNSPKSQSAIQATSNEQNPSIFAKPQFSPNSSTSLVRYQYSPGKQASSATSQFNDIPSSSTSHLAPIDRSLQASRTLPSLKTTLQESNTGFEARITDQFTPEVTPRDPIFRNLALVSQIKDEEIADFLPSGIDGVAKTQFFATYRLRALNKAISKMFEHLPLSSDPQPALDFYAVERKKILGGYSNFNTLTKRKADSRETEDENPVKKRKQNESVVSGHALDQVEAESSKSLTKRKLEEEEYPRSQNCEKRRKNIDQTTTPPKSNLEHHLIEGKSCESTSEDNLSSSKVASVSCQQFTPQKLRSAGIDNSDKSKRKAGNNFNQDMDQASSPQKNLPNFMPSGSISSSNLKESDTANKFRSILEGASSSQTNTPDQGFRDLSENKPNPFASLAASTPAKSINASSNFPSFPKSPTSDSLVSGAIAEGQSLFTSNPSVDASKERSNISDSKSMFNKSAVSGADPANFIAQFGSKAKDFETELMERDKLENMDSDEDEAEWEAKWKEKRLAKAKEVQKIAKSKQAIFIPGKGFVMEDVDSKPINVGALNPKVADSNLESLAAKPPLDSQPNPQTTDTPTLRNISTTQPNNIFGHLPKVEKSKSPRGRESGREGSDLDQNYVNKDPSYNPNQETHDGPSTPTGETGPETAAGKKSNPLSIASNPGATDSSTSSGTATPRNIFDKADQTKSFGSDNVNTEIIFSKASLFGRISPTVNANNKSIASDDKGKEDSRVNAKDTSSGSQNIFSSSLNKTPFSDQTWKSDKPILFGTPTSTEPPIVSVAGSASINTINPSNIFGNLNRPSGSSNLSFSSVGFGGASQLAFNSTAPLSNIFQKKIESQPEAPGFKPFSTSFGSFSAAKPASTGISSVFGKSNETSNILPQATSGVEAKDNNRGSEDDQDTEKCEQVNLSAVGPGEEDEEVVHEVRAKALKFAPKKESKDDSQWQTKGVGPLRILKHKTSGLSRILMRGDPSGKVILNKSILGHVKYQNSNKTVKLLTVSDSGSGFETWILQVKTEELAKKLASLLEEYKPSPEEDL